MGTQQTRSRHLRESYYVLVVRATKPGGSDLLLHSIDVRVSYHTTGPHLVETDQEPPKRAEFIVLLLEPRSAPHQHGLLRPERFIHSLEFAANGGWQHKVDNIRIDNHAHSRSSTYD